VGTLNRFIPEMGRAISKYSYLTKKVTRGIIDGVDEYVDDQGRIQYYMSVVCIRDEVASERFFWNNIRLTFKFVYNLGVWDNGGFRYGWDV